MNDTKKPMVNLQVKVLPELFEDFERQYADSDCKTKGQFFELIWESFLNPKTKEVRHEADAIRIKELEGIIAAQQQELTEASKIIQENKTVTGAIVLNLDADNRRELWGVLEVCKKQGWASSYEELIAKMFQTVRKRGEMILDDEDRAYLETLTYPE